MNDVQQILYSADVITSLKKTRPDTDSPFSPNRKLKRSEHENVRLNRFIKSKNLEGNISQFSKEQDVLKGPKPKEQDKREGDEEMRGGGDSKATKCQ